MPVNAICTSQLREKVQAAYSSAAESPAERHPFPIFRDFARSLGYPDALLADVPTVGADAFAGVSNVSVFADIPSGMTVLDLGCGSGLDALIAARRVGSSGKIIGLDFSSSMLCRAREAVRQSDAANVELREANAEQLPIEDGEIDVAMVNGIFNLNPARDAIFRELARVMRPGGVVFVAELILSGPLPPEVKVSEANWFAWIAGAKEGDAFLNEFRQVGFSDVLMLRKSRNARTKHPLVLAAEVRAIR